MVDIKKQYENDGYYLAKSVFTNEFCDKLKNHLNNLEPKVKIPFSDVPYGYGNLLNEGSFEKVTQNDLIKKLCEELLDGNGYRFNHLVINSKAPWIGGTTEWHQETFHIDTYGPGCTSKDYRKFIQIYIALDKHTIENGCLKIIPQSHKEGELEFEDCIGSYTWGHKRRLSSKSMDSLYNKYNIKNVLMEPGDILFFNHLLAHSSASNLTNLERRSIVLQATHLFEKDESVFEKFNNFRVQFVVDNLSKIINKLKNQDFYKDFNKKDNNEI
mgnify:CR=1 FL=1|jgi:hypothetical protein